MNETIRIMKNHRCIRDYLTKKIPDAIVDELVAAAQAAPSSINSQEISLIVVRERARRERFAEIAGGQPWIAQAPLFIVFVADLYKAKLAADKVGKPLVISDSIEATIAVSIDAGLCMANVITAAESLGLGIVPIGGIRANPQEVIELLELPEYTYPINGLAIGYPADRSRQKPRMPVRAFRHDECYDRERLPELIDAYDREMQRYLRTIGRQDIEGDWSNNTMNYYSRVYFPNVYQTMQAQGFKNKK